MKTFRVYLGDSRSAKVYPDMYRHEGNQYVFDRADTSEVQFFIDSQVVGIFEADAPEMPEAARLDEGSLPSLAKAEEGAMVQALAECAGNRTQTARMLGISRRALIYKLKRLHKDNLPS